MKITFFGMLMTLLISTPTYIFAQVSAGGTPTTFEEDLGLTDIPIIHLPKISNKELQKNAQKIAEAFGDKPFGRDLPVTIDFVKEGKWEYLSSGQKVCRLNIKSESALGLRVAFSKFHLPPSGRLFIYSKDKTEKLGAFTSANNKASLVFATREIQHNDIIIEYSSNSYELAPLINIGAVTHIYDDSHWINRSHINKSASCHNDVNCSPWVSDWCNEIRSVVQFDVVYKYKNLETGEETFEHSDGKCSGVVINNANQDFDPLILTSSHCVTGTRTGVLDGVETERSYAQYDKWIVYYNFQSPTCSSPSQNGNDLMTTVGVDLLYEGHGSPGNTCGDNALLRVSDYNYRIPLQYNVYYAGWNIRDNLEIDDELVMIHHPASDVKKIGTGILEFRADSDYQPNENHCYYKIKPNGSIVEGGSSGSPLFEVNTHQVIGNASFLVDADDNTCEEPSAALYGRLNQYFEVIRDYLVPNGNMLILEVGGADPIGACQDEIELSGPFYPGNDWQAKNEITIQAASHITTGKTNKLADYTKILKSDNSHTNLNNTSDYTLVAGNSITLNQGFHATKGNRLHAKIGDCQAFEGCGFNYAARVIPPKDILEEKEDIFSDLQIDFPNLKVYPNPNDGNFTIELSDYALSQEVSIRITNTMGQEVYSAIMTNNRTTLNVSHLSDGIYYLQINVEGEILTQKLVIAR